MPAPARATTANPLAAAALALPAGISTLADPAVRMAGALFMLLFAWDQADTFGRHFTGTWVFAVAVAAVAIATAVPVPGVRGAWMAAFGAAVLFFGGAMFASMWSGLAALCCGALAWLIAAALAHQRGYPPLPAIAGLVLGAAVTLAAVVATILAVE